MPNRSAVNLYQHLIDSALWMSALVVCNSCPTQCCFKADHGMCSRHHRTDGHLEDMPVIRLGRSPPFSVARSTGPRGGTRSFEAMARRSFQRWKAGSAAQKQRLHGVSGHLRMFGWYIFQGGGFISIYIWFIYNIHIYMLIYICYPPKCLPVYLVNSILITKLILINSILV